MNIHVNPRRIKYLITRASPNFFSNGRTFPPGPAPVTHRKPARDKAQVNGLILHLGFCPFRSCRVTAALARRRIFRRPDRPQRRRVTSVRPRHPLLRTDLKSLTAPIPVGPRPPADAGRPHYQTRPRVGMQSDHAHEAERTRDPDYFPR